jgi:hypothetical protein
MGNMPNIPTLPVAKRGSPGGALLRGAGDLAGEIGHTAHRGHGSGAI